MRLCYISRCYRDKDSAGNKAKTDYEQILASMQAKNLGLRQRIGTGKIATFLLNLAGIIKYALTLRRGDIVVLQYPVKKYFSLICSIATLRKAYTIAFVHDLGSCRRRKISIVTEIQRLNKATHVIAANTVMEQWLIDHGLTAKHSHLGFHDYLCPAQPQPQKHQAPWRLTYAGSLNMRKNAFMLEMSAINIPLCLYGWLGSYQGNHTDTTHINELGYTTPQQFITSAQGDFGLVWDGSSLTSCTGDWGEYLALNTPHKCSFYLRAHLPLIIWSGAAMAAEVQRRNIGICIDSLQQLPDILAAITAEQYATMRTNVAAIAHDIADGTHMRTAITKAISQLSGQ
ncbi:MAG: galactofuranosyltransferase [Paramuribaculum sp.]|nr:galactofuranosyltransferase [Paramuribaculum sp.]